MLIQQRNGSMHSVPAADRQSLAECHGSKVCCYFSNVRSLGSYHAFDFPGWLHFMHPCKNSDSSFSYGGALPSPLHTNHHKILISQNSYIFPSVVRYDIAYDTCMRGNKRFKRNSLSQLSLSTAGS